MNIIDICILVILGFFGIKGLIRGIILEVFTLIGLLIGYILALREMSTVTGFVVKYIAIPELIMNSLAFLIIFLAVIFVFRWLAGLLRKFAEWSLIVWVDKIGGLAFGVFKGSLIASLVILLISLLPVPEKVQQVQDKSVLFKPVRAVAPAVFNLFEKTFPETKDFYDEVKEGFKESSDEVIDKLKSEQLDKLKNNMPGLDDVKEFISDDTELDQLQKKLEQSAGKK